MRILIADDEKELGRMFKTMLRSRMPKSYIDLVVNGAQAEDSMRNGNYDVVLLDGSMPDKDGYDVCLEMKEICKQRGLKMPFVIFCSGYEASEEMKELLADKSHYAFLQKPVKWEQLIATIEAVS